MTLSSDGSPWSEAELLTAFHEAGHAVMAELCGQHITKVEIEGDEDHTGSFESLRFPPDPSEADSPEAAASTVEARLKCVLAGTVAEAMVSGRDQWDESSEDIELAVRLAMQLVDDCEDVLPLLSDIRDELTGELQRNWDAVEALAAELLNRKSLTGAEVRKLLTPLLQTVD
jgi:ATP-dependent Zn protease